MPTSVHRPVRPIHITRRLPSALIRKPFPPSRIEFKRAAPVPGVQSGRLVLPLHSLEGVKYAAAEAGAAALLTLFVQGGDMYGPLPPTISGLALPFIYPVFAAMVLTPLALLRHPPTSPRPCGTARRLCRHRHPSADSAR